MCRKHDAQMKLDTAKGQTASRVLFHLNYGKRDGGGGAIDRCELPASIIDGPAYGLTEPVERTAFAMTDRGLLSNGVSDNFLFLGEVNDNK